MASATMLKHRDEREVSVHAQRINEARWAVLAESLRNRLLSGGHFQSWEANAISDAMIEVVRETGGVSVDRLASALHARQFPILSAKQIAKTIANTYGDG